MEDKRIKTNGVEIVYQTIGEPSGTPLLLVMGLGMQLIHWDLRLCEALADRGFHVIRFDNRDSGLSTQVDAPVPPIMRAMAGFLVGERAVPASPGFHIDPPICSTTWRTTRSACSTTWASTGPT